MPSTEPGAVPRRVSERVLNALRARKPLWRFLAAFCRDVEKAGGKAYLAGGIVRDLAEGRPGKDVDLMVSDVDFDRLGGILRSLPQRPLGIRKVLHVGKAFSVYKVRVGWSDADIDVALARTERSTGPGHREFRVRTKSVGAREDAARRDFTINSLFFSFRTENGRLCGTVADYFGGLADLRKKIIRGVGDAEDRFREDPLRILRAIRQKNERTGFSIERKTWAAIRRTARDRLRTISGERVIEELVRSLAADPEGTLDDLRRSGILRILLPELGRLPGNSFARMKRRYAILRKRMRHPLPEHVTLANLLVDIAERETRRRRGGRCRLPRTEGVARRLHFPNVRNVVRMLEDLERLRGIRGAGKRHAAVEAVFAKRETREPLLRLYEAASLAARRKPVDLRAVLRAAARRPALLSGRRLVELGIPPGPGIDAILGEVREATLAGVVGTAEEAERLAIGIHKKSRMKSGRTRR